ncbi:hypothetical protein CIK74_06280 [Glutamicibacter sp. BW77]|nr:hypothetical protein CIK74_06280 [Glutamicibacter sp. BW77]
MLQSSIIEASTRAFAWAASKLVDLDRPAKIPEPLDGSCLGYAILTGRELSNAHKTRATKVCSASAELPRPASVDGF